MKKIMIIMLGILLIGANVYAAGDLLITGRLGIGTNSPDYPLSLIGSGVHPISLYVETDNITNMKLRSTSGTDNIAFVFDNWNSITKNGGIWTFQVEGTTGIWQIRDATYDATPFRVEQPSTAAQSNAFYINSVGNVGIGKTDPVSKLAVDGLSTSPPDASGNMGMVCITNDGNMWVDADGTYDCQ
jgi:hypothetical protein